MTEQTVRAAVEEAKRFIKSAEIALATTQWHANVAHTCNTSWPCKQNSAAKRASLDLTRALAEMRRPG